MWVPRSARTGVGTSTTAGTTIAVATSGETGDIATTATVATEARTDDATVGVMRIVGVTHVALVNAMPSDIAAQVGTCRT